MTRYVISDEPRPTRFAKVVVHPLAPLIAAMIGPALFAWGWFVLNGFAFGSATRGRELMWGFGGIVACYLVLFVGLAVTGGSTGWLPYIRLAMLACRLAAGYAIFVAQMRTLDLYEKQHGVAGDGPVALLGAVVTKLILNRALPEEGPLLLLPLL